MIFDLFSDIFTYRDNALTRVDPRVKIVITLAALIAVVTAAGIVLPLCSLATCLAAAAALRIPFRLVAVRLLAPLSAVAVLVVLQALLVGTTPLLTFSLGGWEGSVRAEGLAQGLRLGARVLGAVAIVFLLSVATPTHRLFQGLSWFRLSRGWLEIAFLMYRYLFVLMDRVTDLAAAQRLRLGYRTAGRSLSSFTALTGATLIHSFEQAERTHAAMRLRGYRGTIPCGPLPRLGRRDRLILTAALLLIVAGRLLEGGLP